MKHIARTLDHFWGGWRSEYLSELRKSHRFASGKNSRVPQLTTGDIVIVHDDAAPRGHWKLGKLMEIYHGRDGLPRSALVKVASRDRQHSLLKRPLQRLHPLEISSPPSQETPASSSQETPASSSQQNPTNPSHGIK